MNPAGRPVTDRFDELEHLRARIAELEANLRYQSAGTSASDNGRNEAALRLSHEILRQLPDAVVVTDLRGVIVRWQGRAREIFGYSTDEAVGQDVSFLCRPDRREPLISEIVGSIRETGRFQGEISCVRRDGSNVSIEAAANAICDKDGSPLYLVGILKDITGRKTAEQKLQQSEMKLAEAQAIAHVGSWEWDIRSNTVSWSDELFRIYGISRDDFDPSYEAYLQRLHPEDRGRAQRIIKAAFISREPFSFEHRVIRADGSVRTIWARGRVIVNEAGVPVAMVGTGQDITEQKRVEQKFRALLEAAPEAMVIVGSDGRIVLVNSETERMFGYRREELLGQPVELLVPERERERHEGHRGHYFDAPKSRPPGKGLDLYARRKDGSEFPAEISFSPLETEEGVLVTSTIRDITERKQAEEAIRSLNAELELRVEQRTAELQRSNEDLQQFAYIASHDLQEPLRTITAYTQLLAKRYQGKLGPDADEFIEYAVNGARRMTSLIQDLLSYSRAINQTVVQPLRPADVEGVLRMVQGNLAAAIRESGAVITNDSLPKVMADFGQLMQLIQNLISNSIKYRGEDAPRIHVGAERCGDEWTIFVRDNGIGIDPRYAERIFMPFKRLHGREQPGTGIGLAICKKNVERHKGRIWLESEPGKGATFYFTMPAVSDE